MSIESEKNIKLSKQLVFKSFTFMWMFPGLEMARKARDFSPAGLGNVVDGVVVSDMEQGRTYTYIYLSLSLSIYIYIYIYRCVYIYIYIYTQRSIWYH